MPRAHVQRALATARRILGCDHLAADAVQEALLALWWQPAPPPDPRGWLVRSAVHRSLHLRRTLLRRRRRERHVASEACDLHPACDNPLHVACAHELGERIAAAMAALPAEQRVAFELFEGEGLDYRAIAARLRAPVGTVRSRLHRARTALQRALAPLAADRDRSASAASSDRSG